MLRKKKMYDIEKILMSKNNKENVWSYSAFKKYEVEMMLEIISKEIKEIKKKNSDEDLGELMNLLIIKEKLKGMKG